MALSGMVWGGHAVVAWEVRRFAQELEGVAADLSSAMARCTTWHARSRDELDRRLEGHRRMLTVEAERLREVVRKDEARVASDPGPSLMPSPP